MSTVCQQSKPHPFTQQHICKECIFMTNEYSYLIEKLPMLQYTPTKQTPKHTPKLTPALKKSNLTNHKSKKKQPGSQLDFTRSVKAPPFSPFERTKSLGSERCLKSRELSSERRSAEQARPVRKTGLFQLRSPGLRCFFRPLEFLGVSCVLFACFWGVGAFGLLTEGKGCSFCLLCGLFMGQRACSSREYHQEDCTFGSPT